MPDRSLALEEENVITEQSLASTIEEDEDVSIKDRNYIQLYSHPTNFMTHHQSVHLQFWILN